MVRNGESFGNRSRDVRTERVESNEYSDLYGSNTGNESLDVDNGVAVESSNVLGSARREQDGLHARRTRIPGVLVAPVLHQVLQFLQ